MKVFRPYNDLRLPDTQSKTWWRDIDNNLEHSTIPKSHHDDIDKLELHNQVPAEIRDYFDGIRMLWLYGWFCYLFYDWVDLHSRICVERALRIRFQKDNVPLTTKKGKEKKAPGLFDVLNKAVELRYLSDIGFSPTTTAAGELLNLMLFQKQMDEEINEIAEMLNDEGVQVEPIEIEHRTLIDELSKVFPKIRNLKAHGTPGSYETPWSSMLTMEITRGIIFQLFPAK